MTRFDTTFLSLFRQFVTYYYASACYKYCVYRHQINLLVLSNIVVDLHHVVMHHFRLFDL